MIGQAASFGIFATQTIPSDTLLAEYTGIVQARESEQTILETLGERYRIDLGDCPLVVNAKTHRNEMSLINDYRQVIQAANVEYVNVTVDGWPHVFVKTVKTISPGNELLVDYGSDYWAAFRETEKLEAEVQERIQQAASKAREEGREQGFEEGLRATTNNKSVSITSTA